MKRLSLILAILLVSYSSYATAQVNNNNALREETNSEATVISGATDNQEVSASDHTSLQLQKPNGELFGTYKAEPAKNGAISGYIIASGATLISFVSWYTLTLGNIVLETTSAKSPNTAGSVLGAITKGYFGGLFYACSLALQNVVFGITAITAPIINALALRTGIWNSYQKHTLFDALSWSFYGVAMGCGALTLISYCFPQGFFQTFGSMKGLINFTTLGCTLFSMASLAMFSTKALKAYKMAKKLNDQQWAELNYNHHAMAIAPAAAPLIGNNKISGATIGLVAAF